MLAKLCHTSAVYLAASAAVVSAFAQDTPFISDLLKRVATYRELRAHKVDIQSNYDGDGDLLRAASVDQVYLTDLKGMPVDNALKQLTVFRELRTLGLGGMEVTDRGLAALRAFKSLEELDLQHCRSITGRGLKVLAELPELKELSLSEARISAADLVHTARPDKLEFLDLSDSHVRDDLGLVLLQFPNLKRVDLHSTFVSDRCLQCIAKLPHLEYVGLVGTKVTDAGLRYLHSLRNLQELDLRGTGVSKKAVQQLKDALPTATVHYDEDYDEKVEARDEAKQLAAIQRGDTISFSADDCRFNDDRCAQLAACDKAVFIDLSWTAITDAGLRHLQVCENLEDLNLSRTFVTGQGIKQLARLKKLRRLDLSRTLIDDGVFSQLAKLQSLEECVLKDTRITGKGIKQLAAVPNLKELYLSGTFLSDDALHEIRSLGKLRIVELQHTNVTRGAVEKLRKECPNLEVSWIDPESVE